MKPPRLRSPLAAPGSGRPSESMSVRSAASAAESAAKSATNIESRSVSICTLASESVLVRSESRRCMSPPRTRLLVLR